MYKDKQIANFITALCGATIPDENHPEEIREKQRELAQDMLKTFSFIPEFLYREDHGELVPTKKCRLWYKDMQNAPGKIAIPFSTYDNNFRLGRHVVSDRATADDRWQLIGSIAQFMRENEEWRNYSAIQTKGLLEVGLLFKALEATASYQELVTTPDEVESTHSEEE